MGMSFYVVSLAPWPFTGDELEPNILTSKNRFEQDLDIVAWHW